MRYDLSFWLFLSAVLLSSGPLNADDDNARSSVRSAVSQAEAIRIARGYGMVKVKEVERDDGGWEIEGRDHRDRKLQVKINRQGRVTQVDRDNDDD